ncbi:MAG: 50S ribosomal protein L23 [bacterium]
MDVIKKPLVTEKAMKIGENNQYAFIVEGNANKIEIKKAVEELFEVNVTSVRTLNVKGKIKSRFTRKGIQRGKTAGRKKAFVTLKEGQTIDLVSGETSE